eukprot:1199234-Amorphochlora_amoeboformis.AAC.1
MGSEDEELSCARRSPWSRVPEYYFGSGLSTYNLPSPPRFIFCQPDMEQGSALEGKSATGYPLTEREEE